MTSLLLAPTPHRVFTLSTKDLPSSRSYSGIPSGEILRWRETFPRSTMVSFNARLPSKITKEPKWFLASCPILDVHSQGDTEQKAKKNLVETTSLFLVSCFERGILDEVLKKCGFSPIRRSPGISQNNPNYEPPELSSDPSRIWPCHF